MIVIAAIMCAPLLCVDIPPLVDVPGHTGAAAIESAAAGSPLLRYYTWHWTFMPNMGGEVLMHVLGGGVASGWWTTLIATALCACGAMACMRVLNPRGAYAQGWSLIFVLGFPWVWGFLNFLLACGLAMLVFAWTQSMPARSPLRAAALLLTQPVIFSCHAIGGVVLCVLVVAGATGKALDARRAGQGRRDDRALMLDVALACWPLAATPLLIALWKQGAAAPVDPGMVWDFHAKRGLLLEVLRDQWQPLDMASAILAYLVVLIGIRYKARWNWQQGMVALGMVAMYIALPARIDGSQAVDSRMLSIAAIMVAGLQDWSKAPPAIARTVAIAGGAILALRLLAITLGFMAYAQAYRDELAALDLVEPGTRVFSLNANSCSEVDWRMARHDNLASLASLTRQVWINRQWTIRGLDMLESRYDPAPGHP